MEEERKAGNILTVLDSLDGGISCAKKRSTVKQILTRQFFKTEIKTVLAGIFLEKTERFFKNVSSCFSSSKRFVKRLFRKRNVRIDTTENIKSILIFQFRDLFHPLRISLRYLDRESLKKRL